MNLQDLQAQLGAIAPEFNWTLQAISKDKLNVRIINHEGSVKEYSTKWVVEKCIWNTEGTAFKLPNRNSEF